MITVAGFDPAFQRDACAGGIVRSDGKTCWVCAVWERRPEKGVPLVPSETVKEFSALALRHGATMLASDIHYRQSVIEHLDRRLTFVDAPGGNSGKAEIYGVARELIHAGRVQWSAGHKKLTQQMREVIAKPLAGGLIAITSPRRRGAHGDIASAVCLALWLAVNASRHETNWELFRYAESLIKRGRGDGLEPPMPHQNQSGTRWGGTRGRGFG